MIMKRTLFILLLLLLTSCSVTKETCKKETKECCAKKELK